jgi:hypothetical protein
MADLDIGNFFITTVDGVSGDTVSSPYVCIEKTSLDYDAKLTTRLELEKKVTKSKAETTAPQTEVVSLKELKMLVTVHGLLCSDTTKAIDKLITLFELQGLGGNPDFFALTSKTKRTGFVECVSGLSAQTSRFRFRGLINQIKATETPGVTVDPSPSSAITEKYPNKFEVTVSILVCSAK